MINKLKKILTSQVYQPLYYTSEVADHYTKTSVCAGTLVGKNAIVTGGGSGIGLAVAKRLLYEGCHVVITGRNEEKLVLAKSGINENREKLHIITWDHANYSDMDIHLSKAGKMLPNERFDILVNNAGVYTQVDRNRQFINVTENEYDEIIKINLKGTYLLTEKVINEMIRQKNKGHIVNIASICALFRNFQYTPYGISKAGIIAMTKEFSQKYKEDDIIVNGIAPGSVVSSMGIYKENDNISKPGNVLNRMIIPEEIASLTAFLASDLGRHLSGQIIAASACEVL